MLYALDIAFFVLHSLLMFFNLFGWAWRRTRWLHLASISIMVFCWFGLGAWYGWGYCPCTDWHYQVRRALGYQDTSSSYIQLLAAECCHLPISREWSDIIAVIALIYVLLAMALVWGQKLFTPAPVQSPAAIE